MTVRRRLSGTAHLLLATAVLGALSVVTTPVEADAAGAPRHRPVCGTDRPHFSGTFLQPSLASSWDAQDWDAELTHLREACLSDLVLQWTADSGQRTTSYPTGLPGYVQSPGADVVGAALAAADEHGMGVYVGLQVNDDWWEVYSADEAWLAAEADAARALADELWEAYGAHESFAGWYLPFEVDNWHHQTRAHWDAMAGFYAAVTGHLEEVAPGTPVVIAPFYNTAGGLDLEGWRRMWASILPGSGIDAIALQDGIGVDHAELTELADWFGATAAAIGDAGVDAELWADVETFTGGPEPMQTGEYVASMRAIEPYVSRYWSFAYSHYQSPRQVAPQHHERYLEYLRTGEAYLLPPLATPAR